MVPIDRQTIVKEYWYFTNDVYTGKLYLLDSPIDDQIVSFQSAYTGLKTPWHGYWVGDEVSLLVHFDYRGDRSKARWKYADVCVERRLDTRTLEVRPGPKGIYKGIDHDRRRIEIRITNVYYFDRSTRQYVVQHVGQIYGFEMIW